MTEPTGAADPTPARRARRDAFDGERRRVFLEALKKCACLRDAARKARVSHQTVYNHQAADPAFARQCELALDMAGTDVELHAWERGVAGIKEPVFDRAGEVVGYRVKRSDNILRLLLQGAKRKKYGPNPGFTRKRLHKFERKRIRQEVRAEFWAERRAGEPPIEEVRETILARIRAMEAHNEPRKLAEGWTKTEEGRWIPPGWVRAEGWAALADPDDRGDERGEPAVRFV